MNAALNGGDIDDALTHYAPDAEVRDLANGPDQPTLVRGTDQIREIWALWTAAFDELHADVEEFLDAGDGGCLRIALDRAGKDERHVDRRSSVRRI